MIFDKIQKREIIILKDTEEIDETEDAVPIYDSEIDLTEVFKIENNILKIDDKFREKYSLEIDDWYLALLISCNDTIKWEKEYKTIYNSSIVIGQDWNGNYYSASLTTGPYSIPCGDSIDEESKKDDTMTWLLRRYNGIYAENEKKIFYHLFNLRDTIKRYIYIQKEKLKPKEFIFYED